jgi:elongation factor 3
VKEAKTAPSQKLDAKLVDSLADLSLEKKTTAQDEKSDELMNSVLASSSQDARAKAAKELTEKIKEVGVGALGSLGIVPKLSEALQEPGKVGQRRAGALAALGEILAVFGGSAEPWTIGLLYPVLDCLGHKSAEVRALATPVANKMFEVLSDQAVRLVLPAIFEGLKHDKEEVKLLVLDQLAAMTGSSKRQPLALELYEIVPILSEVMWDADDDVVAAATSTMGKCCETAENRDLAPFAPSIIKSIANPVDVPECVHKLAATVFVQEIKSPALAVTVPLLQRGLNDADTVIRRKACTIVDNMCKMIDHPEEAVSFMPKIMPIVEKAALEIPDPEARGVAERAFKTLTNIKEMAIESKRMEVGAVLESLKEALAGIASPPSGECVPGWESALEHVAQLCAVLVSNRNFEASEWSKVLETFVEPLHKGAAQASDNLRQMCFKATRVKVAQEDLDEEGEDLCNIEFSLGYGALMLLTNTRLHMKRGKRYALIGPNGCGKTTLMRAIVNQQVEGFPPPDQVRTAYVEHDIQGADTDLQVVDFLLADDKLRDSGCTERKEIEDGLRSVGFTDDLLEKKITALSGGWKMKVALARGMLMRADILLMDEPTNHLDVANVAWLKSWITSQTNVTCLIVSHDSGFLDEVSTHVLQFEKGRKLKTHLGNLTAFVSKTPEARAYFELASEQLVFKLPNPGFLEGINSKGKPILKMESVYFTYPGNSKPTVKNIALAASLASRVAVIGPNGAGKSTIIKILTGELKADEGSVWRHPNMRVAYVAQHAFHHLEQHQDKTPNEYIQWRYAGGEDREALKKEANQITEEEQAKMEAALEIETKDGLIEKRVVEEIIGRKKLKNSYEYEIKWVGLPADKNEYVERAKLIAWGFTKMVQRFDEREALRLGTAGKALTARNVEEALGNMGLEAEFATHNRVRGLSGGQKVKVVLAAAMWEDPHILVLDEPTNYLDRDSLGALASAIKEYQGGVIMISHNREFTGALCPETWICENGQLRREGESYVEDVKLKNPDDPFTGEKKTIKDAFGNTVEVKKKKNLTGAALKKYQKMKEARKKRGEDVSETESDDE